MNLNNSKSASLNTLKSPIDCVLTNKEANLSLKENKCFPLKNINRNTHSLPPQTSLLTFNKNVLTQDCRKETSLLNRICGIPKMNNPDMNRKSSRYSYNYNNTIDTVPFNLYHKSNSFKNDVPLQQTRGSIDVAFKIKKPSCLIPCEHCQCLLDITNPTNQTTTADNTSKLPEYQSLTTINNKYHKRQNSRTSSSGYCSNSDTHLQDLNCWQPMPKCSTPVSTAVVVGQFIRQNNFLDHRKHMALFSNSSNQLIHRSPRDITAVINDSGIGTPSPAPITSPLVCASSCPDINYDDVIESHDKSNQLFRHSLPNSFRYGTERVEQLFTRSVTPACPCLCHDLLKFGLLSNFPGYLPSSEHSSGSVNPHITSAQNPSIFSSSPVQTIPLNSSVVHSNKSGSSISGLKCQLLNKIEETFKRAASLRSSVPKSSSSTSISRDVASSSHSLQVLFNESIHLPLLIMESRPGNLPPKCPLEECRHKNLYDRIIQSTKKKEARNMKRCEQEFKDKCKYEDRLSQILKIWTQDILPFWHEMKSTKKTYYLWSLGLPPSIRGKVWYLALTENTSADDRASKVAFLTTTTTTELGDLVSSGEYSDSNEIAIRTLSNVRLDVNRTFPQLCIFQERGPYHDQLIRLLMAYSSYQPEIGYVQGMSFIGATLLLNMDLREALVCFCNLLELPCFQTFYSLNQQNMQRYFDLYSEFLESNLPELYDHFCNLNFTPDLYLTDWIYTIYSKSLSLDLTCKIWDLFLLNGETFLFKAALGILKLNEEILLKMDFMQSAQYLTKLPEDVINPDDLFSSISKIII